jgi:hypothetical protein
MLIDTAPLQQPASTGKPAVLLECFITATCSPNPCLTALHTFSVAHCRGLPSTGKLAVLLSAASSHHLIYFYG